MFCSTICSKLDEADEANEKYCSKAGCHSYNNSHDQQNQSFPRGKVVKQFSQVTFEHIKGVMICLAIRVVVKQLILTLQMFTLDRSSCQGRSAPERKKYAHPR
jgi:hypothetical protein